MKKVALTLLCLLPTIVISAQILQDSALVILKSNIANYDDCDIYSVNDTIDASDTIKLMGSRIIIPPQGRNWMFFVDEKPLANWAHPCKYVFVKINSGNCDIINSSSPPINISLNAIKRALRTSNDNVCGFSQKGDCFYYYKLT